MKRVETISATVRIGTKEALSKYAAEQSVKLGQNVSVSAALDMLLAKHLTKYRRVEGGIDATS